MRHLAHRKLQKQLIAGTTPEKKLKNVNTICSSHNFSPLFSVQIIIISACCLLCVL